MNKKNDYELLRKYHLLIRHILKNGKSYPKKHGNWYKLDLFKDYFLELDSWNNKICFCRREGKYNEWTGFNGKSVTERSLAIDFGGFECYHPETVDWLVRDVLKIKIYDYGQKQ